MPIVFSRCSLRAAALMRGESLQSCWVQCPQRHQWPDGNVLSVHQLCLREWQRFHECSRFVFGLRVNQEDNAFAVATRIPLADFPVKVELRSCPNFFRYQGMIC